MTSNVGDKNLYVENIKKSGFSIYDEIEIGDPELWIPTSELENLLNKGLVGISLSGLPLRTRSKVVKEHVCKALGYPVPSGFKKTQPRFPRQFFDTYTQKSNNLQVWNEELVPSRRYVIIRIGESDTISKVKIVTGYTLALLDTTGTLTQKYQARLILGVDRTELIANEDSGLLHPFVQAGVDLAAVVRPREPSSGSATTPDP